MRPVLKTRNRPADRKPRTVARSGSVKEEFLRDRQLGLKRDTKLDDPEPTILRQYINDQICWWCETGPWKVLAGHTSKAHGITARELRDLAGFFKHTRVCSEAHSDFCAKRQENRDMTALFAAPRPTGKHVMSEAGSQRSRDMIARIHADPNAEQQRIDAARIGAIKNRKPHPCTACGKIMGTSYPLTCSPECRKEIRRQTAAAGMGSMDRTFLKRPTPCKVCGAFMPTRRPNTCSAHCLGILRRQHRRKHPCTICGKETGHYQKRTCSQACLATARHNQGVRYAGALRRPR